MRGAGAKVLRFFLWCYGIYLAISLLVILPALNIAAPWAVREFLGRELRHDLILFNPFTLTVEARGAAIHEEDGHNPLAIRKAAVSLSTASIWREGIVLDDLRIVDLDLHVLRYADGGFHFDDLLEGTEEPEPESGPLPGISIERLFFGAHTLRFTDRTRPGPYSEAYSDFSVETRDITTLPNRSGDGELTVRGADGGVLRWRGELAIADGYSRGHLALDQLDLTHLWLYESERLAFIAESIALDMALDYDVNWSSALRFAVTDGSVRLHDVSLVPKDTVDLPHTSVELSELQLSAISVDSQSQRVDVGDVSIRGAHGDGFATAERSSLVDMFTIAARESDAEEESERSADESREGLTEESESSEDGEPWQIVVATVSLDESSIDWRSDNLAPETMRMAPMQFSATDVSWPALSPSGFDVALSINDQTHASADGSLNLGSGSGDINYSLATLPLPWFNPVLSRFVQADVGGGDLSVSGSVNLKEFAPQNIRADSSLTGFAMQIFGAEDSALAFQELAVTGTSVDMANSAVSIDDIMLQSLRGTLRILEDGSMNVATAMINESDAEGDSGTESAQGAENAAVSEDQPAEPWAVRVGHVGIRDGRVDFSDASLPLPFQTLIGDIEADIEGLDSSAEQPMTAVLNGAVDGYAPVVIEASGKPLATPRDAQLTLRFRGMDIATMSPYSGTYAGYTIDSGTLSIDLVYDFQGTTLAGDNRIVISQMELGEPIESERAMQLPLQLGIALLTDAEGVIDLAVPISGDVDDPQFSLAGVIGSAIANVIIKAATAPFRLLAGLVNSEEDLENIAFDAGSAELTESSRSALGTLAEALQKRPKLQLRIIGSSEPGADRKALQAEAFELTLLEAGLTAEAIAAQSGAYRGEIDSRYAALGLAEPEDGAVPDLAAKVATLQSRIELPPGTLQDLGTNRATEAKRELVTVGGVDAARIAVSYDRSLLITSAKMSLDG